MFKKVLIISVLITSLIPFIFIDAGKLVGYAPFFILLSVSVIYALMNLKASENLDHIKTYYSKNKFILYVLFLYVFLSGLHH